MEDFQEILPVSKAKRDLLDLIKRMEEEESTIALTRNGEAVGVMMTLSRYEALLEMIEILCDPQLLWSLRKSVKDFQAGKVVNHEAAWED